MRCVAEVSSFNLMYNLSMYYEKQKSYDKTELTFQPTLVFILFQFYENDFAILLFIFIVFSVFYLANMSRASGADAGLPTPMSQIKQKDKNYLLDM